MRKLRNISIVAVISLLSAILVCTALLYALSKNRNNMDALEMSRLLEEKSNAIYNIMLHSMHKAEIMSVLVKQADGNLSDFELVAESLMSDSFSFRTMLLAPDGVISQVYPIEGNEVTIGISLFGANTAGSIEALAARDTGQFILSGPFDLVHAGRKAIGGRMPVFFENESGESEFWGLVSITFDFPEILDEVYLNQIVYHGFNYKLWRIDPQTAEEQVIASSNGDIGTHFIEKAIPLLNVEWYLRISVARNWFEFPVNAAIIASLFVCVSVFLLVQNNYRMRKMQNELEKLARTDMLTGIYNRWFFIEISEKSINKSQRLGETCYVVIFDVDRFKNINDKYGHYIGDKVLIEITDRIKSLIRPYDYFARYGGEEFVVHISNVDDDNLVKVIMERMRLSLCDRNFIVGDLSLTISASFGIARIINNDLGLALKNADMALYRAKETGRNKIVLYSEEDFA